MSDKVYLITGVPGFLGKRLVKKLLTDDPSCEIYALVEERFKSKAEEFFDSVAESQKIKREQLHSVVGDITLENIGLNESDFDELKEHVNTVYHLAAIYDLAVPKEIAEKVNVTGTANIIAFLKKLKNLKKLNYISTCYVAGDRKGLIKEDELDMGQGFKNHYESTKFKAEVLVRESMGEIPTTIIRPGIVVGDSKTGETDKYDGPYFLIKFLMKLPRSIPFINIGSGTATVNLVPVDYLINAMVSICSGEASVSRTFQIADSNPETSRDIVHKISKAMGKPKPFLSIPSWLMSGLYSIPGVPALTGVPRQSIIYFNHETQYDTTNTQKALEGTGIKCPPLASYLETMINFVKENPKL